MDQRCHTFSFGHYHQAPGASCSILYILVLSLVIFMQSLYISPFYLCLLIQLYCVYMYRDCCGCFLLQNYVAMVGASPFRTVISMNSVSDLTMCSTRSPRGYVYIIIIYSQ